MEKDTLKIPKDYAGSYEIGAAYEAGFYDGRDEAYDEFIPIDDPVDFVKDIKKRNRVKHWELAMSSDLPVGTVTSTMRGACPSVRNWIKMLYGLGYEVWVRKVE